MASTNGGAVGGLRILVADDDAISRMVVSGMLRRDGHEVDTAIDGVEAVEAASRRVYDLILMDLQMPEMGGIEATRTILASGSAPRRIVALTATADATTREECMEAGFDELAEKPLDAARIRAILMEVPATLPVDAADAAHVTEGGIATESFERFRREVGGHLVRPFAEVVTTSLAEMRIQFDRLDEAVAAGDRATVARLAHTLRGSSATLGAADLAAMMGRIESEATALPDADLSAATQNARNELERAAQELQRRAGREAGEKGDE